MSRSYPPMSRSYLHDKEVGEQNMHFIDLSRNDVREIYCSIIRSSICLQHIAALHFNLNIILNTVCYTAIVATHVVSVPLYL